MQPWERALDIRTELEAWWQSPGGMEFSENWARRAAEAKGQSMATANLHLIEAAKMSLATPVFVAPDMFELWQHAAQDFPGETIEEQDLPIPSGLVVFPKPWVITDLNGDDFKLRGLAWMRARIGDESGVHLSFYVHREDESEEIKSVLPITFSFLHATAIIFGTTYTEAGMWDSALGREITDEAIGNAVRVIRGTQAFWRLAWMQIGKPYHFEVSRPVRKRTLRFNKDRPVPLVTVVALRPFKPGKQTLEDEAHSIEYSHQWMVGGHWRQQYYSSIGGHRAIYISPYVKGPQDKPLVLKDRVYGWTR